ncbi:MAG TPA: sulfotransferase domain-containing protein [Kiloniellales bacterium]
MSQRGRIFVFSSHRSGSTLLYQVCRGLAQRTGYRHYAPNGGDVAVSLRQLAEQPERWLTQPGCFGPLRAYIPVPRPDQARILVHLRDPRDVLVSMFFSYCYSHAGEIAGAIGIRGKAAEDGIDNFVLQMATADAVAFPGAYGTGNHIWDLAGNLRQRYDSYLRNVLDHQESVLVRYEDMLFDPAGWLGDVAGVFGVRDSEVVERLSAALASSPRAAREDRWTHKRQIEPGDHRRKLKGETIGQLNEILGDVLARLGYPA